MADMLVKLYELPKPEALSEGGITVRRAYPSEKGILTGWIKDNFSQGWADECGITFSGHPVKTFIAVRENDILGFAAYDASALGFFGPTGVAESARGLGIGKVLLLETLHAMKDSGYGYGIIGGVGPVGFYSKTVGAVEIEGSTPGIYRGMLKRK